ncbi:MAG: hypothetical protein PUB37_04265 [Firmicutes bacterium]|nr:hypothetical protein [Bacillota bacterium]
MYKKKRAAYARGKAFSILASLFSILFILIVSVIGSEFPEASYDIIKISSSVCPVVIAIINIIAVIWLFAESRNLPEEDEEDDEDDEDEFEFENEDYDDDLTDENAEEFWEEVKKHSYGYYKQPLNKK